MTEKKNYLGHRTIDTLRMASFLLAKIATEKQFRTVEIDACAGIFAMYQEK